MDILWQCVQLSFCTAGFKSWNNGDIDSHFSAFTYKVEVIIVVENLLSNDVFSAIV